MSPSTVVAFVGSVREPHRMIEAINELRFHHDAPDRILLSTWFGEIDRFTGLRDVLNLRGVETVETSEPVAFRVQPYSFINRGHVFHQKLALSNALEGLAPDDWVVKSRPDLKLHEASDLLRILSRSEQPVVSALADDIGARERIRVRQMSLSSPFWLDDTHFAGTASTLSLMTGYDASYDITCHPHIAIPEIRFFHALVAGKYPICDRVLNVPFNFGMFESHGERDVFLTMALEDPFFSKALHAYFTIAAALFDMGGAYGPLHDQRARMIQSCISDHAHLTDGTALKREVARWRERDDADLFAAMAADDYFSIEEWETFSTKLQSIGAVELPRASRRKPKNASAPSRPQPVPPFEDRLALLLRSPDHPSQVEAYLWPLLKEANLNAFIPSKLRSGDEFRATGALLLKAGDVLWNEALGRHSIEIGGCWRHATFGNLEGDPVGLPHSILSDWVFFLPISAPASPGDWQFVLQLRSPSLDVVWKERVYGVQIQALESVAHEPAIDVSRPTWSSAS